MADGFNWGGGQTQAPTGWGGGQTQAPTGWGGGQTQAPTTGFGYNWMGNQNLSPMTNQMGTPFSSGFGFGYQGAYGPTGGTTGQDLTKMAYTYGKDPQALAGQMQSEGVTPWNMQQAGVIGNQQYTQMFRPSSQSQSKLNTNQYYQPIQQSQYQNYASPYYSGLANANNMGAYNALSQANMGPAIGLASQSSFNPYTNTFSTPYGQAYGGLGSVIGSYGTPFALAQQQAALNPYGNTAYMGGYGGYTQPKAGTTSGADSSKNIISNINTGNTSTGTTNLGTATGPTYGANNLSAQDFINSIGDISKNTAQQNFDLAMKNNLSLQDISDLTGMSQQEIADYLKTNNLDASKLKGTAYDPNKTYDANTGTVTDTKIPDWYTNKDYKYAAYKNYTPQDLSGFTKDQVNKLYATQQGKINADIKQATADYNAALTSGNPARIRATQENLNAQQAELAQYNLDYGAATKALTGAKGTYETPELKAARLDTTALGKLDAAAKKYTAYNAPTIKAGSNAAAINKAYSSVITKQQTEMNNAKKALDAAVGPKEKEAAQKYYDAQKAEYDKAMSDLNNALNPKTAAQGGLMSLLRK